MTFSDDNLFPEATGGGLVGLVMALSRALRRAGAGTTLAQSLTAVEGLDLIDLSRRDQLRTLLRTTLVSSRDELDIFDYYFDLYFTPGLDKTPPAVSGGPPRRPGFSGRAETGPASDQEAARPAEPLAVRAGLEEISAQKDFARLDPDEAREMHRQIERLTRKLAGRWKRRLALAGQAERLDFRRTFRGSLQYGGEIIDLRFRGPRPRPRRLVLLCDVSGSMDIYTRFFLTFMFGLSEVLPRTETFVFSTRLVRITPLLKGYRAAEVLDRLARAGLPLSGGTNIGVCLDDFLRRYLAALVNRRTTFFIISDGWDRGDPGLLTQALRSLSHKSRGVIWLNPLAADPNFAPLAQGMAAALPYLQALLPFSRLADLKTLSRYLESTAGLMT